LRTVPVSDGRTNLFRDLPLTNFVFKPSEIPRYEFNFVDTPVVQALEDYEWISKKKLKIDVPPDIQWRKTIVMKTEPGHKLTKWHALRLLEKTLLEQVGIEIDESSDVVTVRYDPTIATHPAQK
jgi:hypothetical protein